MNSIKKYIKDKLYEILDHPEYIFHGTHKGAALSIQRDGFMNCYQTGENKPSISFTSDFQYAKNFSIAKGGKEKMVIIRTKFNDNFILSPRIRNNKGAEYITFSKIPVTNLEILTPFGIWKRLDKWDVIFNEPKLFL